MAKKAKCWRYGARSRGSVVFDTFNVILMLIICVIMLYPMWYVLSCSFSDPMLLYKHRGALIWPLGYSLKGYQKVIAYTPIWNGYKITLIVLVLGTTLNMLFSSLFAYVISRPNLMWRRVITGLAVFTMYFNGGIVPTYLVVKGIKIYDTIWALILPGLIGTYNIIILRTAFFGIPDAMEESARLDGAGELTILFRILLPLIKPTLAAITLFYAVGHWNNWTNALLYIRSEKLRPLQMVVRSLLILEEEVEIAGSTDYETQMVNKMLKYCVIIVSTVPILCIYPFIQKYFTKGIMVGAVKG